MPESYGLSGFRREHLPILPQEFRLVPRQVREGKAYKDDPGVVRQLGVIRELFDRCESIIVATDAGREGELIFRYVYNYLGCTKPIAAILTFVFPDKSRLYNSFLQSVSNIQIPFKNTIFFLKKIG